MEIEVCPLCGSKPEVDYACGDYFIHCSDGCSSPCCDHPNQGTTVLCWNDWARWTRQSKNITALRVLLTKNISYFEKFKSMTIEEMARFFTARACCDLCIHHDFDDGHNNGLCADEKCYSGHLDWLNHPVGE
jgi:hypothetical protein